MPTTTRLPSSFGATARAQNQQVGATGVGVTENARKQRARDDIAACGHPMGLREVFAQSGEIVVDLLA